MNLAELEKRVRVLEDIEAIRNLKARYAAYCDDGYNADKIAELFTEDAVWESDTLGRYEGREAVREFFRGVSGTFSFAIHYYMNPHIEVNGDTAKARWYMIMPCIMADTNAAAWLAGIDEEEYVRVNSDWKFSRKSNSPLFHTSFDEGWARERFMA